jgi:hypothetical protein
MVHTTSLSCTSCWRARIHVTSWELHQVATQSCTYLSSYTYLPILTFSCSRCVRSLLLSSLSCFVAKLLGRIHPACSQLRAMSVRLHSAAQATGGHTFMCGVPSWGVLQPAATQPCTYLSNPVDHIQPRHASMITAAQQHSSPRKPAHASGYYSHTLLL